MIESLLVALILMAIVGLIGWGIATLIPFPPQVKTVLYVVIGVVCLLILLKALTGGLHLAL